VSQTFHRQRFLHLLSPYFRNMKHVKHIAIVGCILFAYACNNTDTNGKTTAAKEKPAVETPEMIEAKMRLHTVDSMLRRDSSRAETWFERGKVQLTLLDTSAAINSFMKADAIEPMDAEQLEKFGFIMAENANDNVFAIADRMLKLSSISAAKGYYFKGLYYANKEQHEKAIVEFDNSILKDYTFNDSYVDKGVSLYKLKKYTEALDAFGKLTQTNSTNADAAYWSGMCYAALDKKDDAKASFQKAVTLDPKFEQAAEELKKY
jgi:tetratricopeptide (TPR) repeat protein